MYCLVEQTLEGALSCAALHSVFRTLFLLSVDYTKEFLSVKYFNALIWYMMKTTLNT